MNNHTGVLLHRSDLRFKRFQANLLYSLIGGRFCLASSGMMQVGHAVRSARRPSSTRSVGLLSFLSNSCPFCVLLVLLMYYISLCTTYTSYILPFPMLARLGNSLCLDIDSIDSASQCYIS